MLVEGLGGSGQRGHFPFKVEEGCELGITLSEEGLERLLEQPV